ARKYKSNVSYPQGRLAASLSVIACMIAGGLLTRVYYASQGGFDTHAGQANAHERLMGELNDALSAFAADLKQQGNFDRVLLMTFSEFGRRVVENANAGTSRRACCRATVLESAAKRLGGPPAQRQAGVYVTSDLFATRSLVVRRAVANSVGVRELLQPVTYCGDSHLRCRWQFD